MIKLKIRPRGILTNRELEALFPQDVEKLARVWGDAGMAVFMLVLAATGIRSGEARALRWKHVQSKRMQIQTATVEIWYLQVEDAVKFTSAEPVIGTTKAGKPRPVFLPERARGALEWWKEHSPWPTRSSDFVFPGREVDRPMDEDLPRQRFKKALEAAEVDAADRWLTPHSLRHSYVSRAKRKLPSDIHLTMVGHEDEKTDAMYFHETLEQMLERIAVARGQIESAAKW